METRWSRWPTVRRSPLSLKKKLASRLAICPRPADRPEAGDQNSRIPPTSHPEFPWPQCEPGGGSKGRSRLGCDYPNKKAARASGRPVRIKQNLLAPEDQQPQRPKAQQRKCAWLGDHVNVETPEVLQQRGAWRRGRTSQRRRVKQRRLASGNLAAKPSRLGERPCAVCARPDPNLQRRYGTGRSARDDQIRRRWCEEASGSPRPERRQAAGDGCQRTLRRTSAWSSPQLSVPSISTQRGARVNSCSCRCACSVVTCNRQG